MISKGVTKGGRSGLTQSHSPEQAVVEEAVLKAAHAGERKKVVAGLEEEQVDLHLLEGRLCMERLEVCKRTSSNQTITKMTT